MTPHQCKYIAHDLIRKTVDGQDRLSMSLFNAAVDLNPHQIEAALFALQSPLSQGCILADEVGLGKTIEAGIVLCQYWAERRRKILIITPASIRKQWALELEEKFNLPSVILDSQSWKDALKKAQRPLEQSAIVLISLNFASRVKEELRSISWDLVVIDEAHKLRNAYRASNKVGQAIRWATEGRRKLLLTATPLQNSLLELYGLSTLIDDNLFGDVNAFRAQYLGAEANLKELRSRLHSFCTRTLRKQVLEYINYTERKAITRPFLPSKNEQQLYEAVSAFLQRESSFAIPGRQKQLTQIILRKLLASSSTAIAGTLATMKARLERIRDSRLQEDEEGLGSLFPDEEIEDELLEEILEETETTSEASQFDRKALQEEIQEIDRLLRCAQGIGVDTKSRSLLSALEIGFSAMAETGAARKALIFTESRRTQDYLAAFLKEHGFAGKLVLFNGSNASPESTVIYQRWLETNKASGRVSGSRDIDIRTALVEYFRDHADIMLATEAAAEGINLQFCSLVVNYDLPWNPQRVEQRIGRCHRYGQKHDVVVINFLNERNEADRRVLELLGEKFRLFTGVFGASDEVLGSIESGVDFEKRILAIYQGCRTPKEIEAAFAALQTEMDEVIKSRLDKTRTLLLENFDEDVHDRLRLRLETTRLQLDRFSRRFWSLTKEMLRGNARFNESDLSFVLEQPPKNGLQRGTYRLIAKNTGSSVSANNSDNAILYRLSHPLGEAVIEAATTIATPECTLQFDSHNHGIHIHAIESLKGKSGYLILNKLSLKSYEEEEHLLFSAFDEDGHGIDQETCEKLFSVEALVSEPFTIANHIREQLISEARRHGDATLSKSLERNNNYFIEAREKLEKWADDMILSAEKALKDTKEQIKALQREARQATMLEEQHCIQQKIQALEKQQRRQRQEIFKVEDEIIEKRDDLIGKLEKRLSQKTKTETLFTIRWTVA